MADELKQLKSAFNEGKVVLGRDRVVKLLRQSKIKKIYLASNTKKTTAADLEHLAKLGGTEVVKLKLLNNELGTFCKKPFAVSVLGVR